MKKAQAFLVTKSYTDYKFSELLFLGAIMFFRNAPGLFYFAFLHSYTSFLGLNNLYLQKLLDRINFIILNNNMPGKIVRSKISNNIVFLLS